MERLLSVTNIVISLKKILDLNSCLVFDINSLNFENEAVIDGWVLSIKANCTRSYMHENVIAMLVLK